MSAVKASASEACFQVRGIRDLSKINAIKQKFLKGHAPPIPVMACAWKDDKFEASLDCTGRPS